jgi:hypothetical protein
VNNWELYILEKLSIYPDVGQAIRRGVPFDPARPTTNDLFPGTALRMYSFLPTDLTTLDPPRLLDFRSAVKTFDKLERLRRDEEAKLCHLLISSFSEETKMLLPDSETQVLSPPAPEFPVSESRPDTPAADFPIPNSATPATGHSNLRTSAQHFPNSEPSQFEHRFPTRSHRVPSRFACSASTTPHTTPSSLFASKSEQAEFSIKKGLLMDNYKHAVGPAITKSSQRCS